MNLQAINDWPVSDYNFAGNGASAAQDPIAGSFSVNTGALTVARGCDARRSAVGRRLHQPRSVGAAGFHRQCRQRRADACPPPWRSAWTGTGHRHAVRHA